MGLDSSGRVIDPTQRPLPDNIQHSQKREIHTCGGVRTHNLSRRAAAGIVKEEHGYVMFTQAANMIFGKRMTYFPKQN